MTVCIELLSPLFIIFHQTMRSISTRFRFLTTIKMMFHQMLICCLLLLLFQHVSYNGETIEKIIFLHLFSWFDIQKDGKLHLNNEFIIIRSDNHRCCCCYCYCCYHCFVTFINHRLV